MYKEVPECVKDKIRECLSYDPETGDLTWIKDAGYSIRAGTKAGGPDKTRRNALRVKVLHKSLAIHRVAFFLMEGEFPDKSVDHIDGDPSNNKWVNLRKASQAENGQNKAPNRFTTSGFHGVSKTQNGKWRARISLDRQSFFLGTFTRPELAHDAYVEAKKRMHTFQPTIPTHTAKG